MQSFVPSQQSKKGRKRRRTCLRLIIRPNCHKSFNLRSLSSTNTIRVLRPTDFLHEQSGYPNVVAETFFNLQSPANVVFFSLRCYIVVNNVKHVCFQARVTALQIQFFKISSHCRFVKAFSLKEWTWCGLSHEAKIVGIGRVCEKRDRFVGLGPH